MAVQWTKKDVDALISTLTEVKTVLEHVGEVSVKNLAALIEMKKLIDNLSPDISSPNQKTTDDRAALRKKVNKLINENIDAVNAFGKAHQASKKTLDRFGGIEI